VSRKRKKQSKPRPTAPLISEGTREQWVFLPLTIILCAAAYWLTLCPTVYVGDSGELSTAAYYLGIPHSPSYPLYCLIGWIFAHLPIPGDVGFQMNLMSAFFALGTVVVLYMIIYHFTRTPYLSFSVSLAYAFSPIFWSQAVVAEVYSLNTFLTALALYFLCRWVEKREDRWIYFASFTMGIAATNHQLALLLLPTGLLMLVLFGGGKEPLVDLRTYKILLATFILIPLIHGLILGFQIRDWIFLILIASWAFIRIALTKYKENVMSLTRPVLLIILLALFYDLMEIGGALTGGFLQPGGLSSLVLPTIYMLLLLVWSSYQKPLRFWIGIAGLYILGLLVYLYLPIRAAADPPLNWGDPETAVDFFNAIVKPAGEQVSTGNRFQHFLHALKLWTIQFSPVVPINNGSDFIPIPIIWLFGLWGIYKGLSTGWRMAQVFTWFIFLNVATILTVSSSKMLLVDVYYLPVFLVFAVFIATGLREWLQTFFKAFGEKKRPVLLALVIFILVLIPINQFYWDRPEADRSHDYYARDYATALLTNVPQNAILIVNWDDIFTMWYLQKVEHVREDVILVLPNFPSQQVTDYWGFWYYEKVREDHPELFKGLDFENSQYIYKEDSLNAFVRSNLIHGRDVYFSFYGLDFDFERLESVYVFPRGPVYRASFEKYNLPELYITQQIWEKTLNNFRNVDTYYDNRVLEEDFIIYRMSDNLLKCGQMALNMKENQLAEWFFGHAVTVDKGNSQARLKLAELKYAKGLKAETESLLLDGTDVDPLNSEIWFNLGLLYLESNQPELASKAFTEVLKLDPYHPDANARLEQVRTMMMNRQDAGE